MKELHFRHMLDSRKSLNSWLLSVIKHLVPWAYENHCLLIFDNFKMAKKLNNKGIQLWVDLLKAKCNIGTGINWRGLPYRSWGSLSWRGLHRVKPAWPCCKQSVQVNNFSYWGQSSPHGQAERMEKHYKNHLQFHKVKAGNALAVLNSSLNG